jgi:hypothetical protein
MTNPAANYTLGFSKKGLYDESRVNNNIYQNRKVRTVRLYAQLRAIACSDQFAEYICYDMTRKPFAFSRRISRGLIPHIARIYKTFEGEHSQDQRAFAQVLTCICESNTEH